MSTVEVVIWLVAAATYVDAAIVGQWLVSVVPESNRYTQTRTDMFVFTIVPIENILVVVVLYAYWYLKWTR